MKYLIIEPRVKAIAPNIALMKWARWCEHNDHECQYVRGRVEPMISPDAILMSCIFSYNSKVYEKTIDFYFKRFPDAKITVGGAFPSLNPKWFDKWNGTVTVHMGLCNEIENLAPKYDVEITSEDENPYPRDKIVLYASRGCSNKCRYCAVPRLEGDMKSFESISGMLNMAKMPYASSVVLFDNNFTDHPHFDNIIDELVDFNLPVDIHGLHVDSFTRHHAKRFAELTWCAQGEKGIPYLRFSFDKLKYADGIRKAFRYVIDEDVKASFFCYLLFNWLDTPDDFWQRIQIAQKIVDDIGETIFLFPQRYEPLNALERNQYIGKHWNEKLVRGLSRLYTQLRGFIPITRSRNVYEWIGHTKEEFLEKAYKMGTDNNYKLRKRSFDRSDKDFDVKFHPVAEIFPMMNAEEFEGLKSDIEKHGLIEPIWTYDGKIIDGRNRYLACQQLGKKPKLNKWKSVNGNELIDFVISLNLKRRHLNTSQKALVAVDALPYYEKVAKKRQKLSQGRGKKGVAKMPQVFHGKSRDIAAKVFGVSGRYVGYAKKINEKDPNLAQEIRDGKKSIAEAVNQIKKNERIIKLKKNAKKYKAKNDVKIVCADFYQWCKENILDHSIDLLLTEPPHTKKDLPVWEKLAEESARVLRPSGFLVSYCGHRYIDKVVHILSKHLNYHWLYCIGFNDNRKNEGQNYIIEQWQPALVYFKPPFKKDKIAKDFSKCVGENSVSYNNQLSESGLPYFVKMFSAPGEVVLDPFMGTGEVLKVSKKLNRMSIGIDVDSDCVEIAKGRLR
jgi:16S rRNA G966 N2-methylase RsmD